MSSACVARVAEAVTEIDPLTDPHWPAFLQKHEAATIFQGLLAFKDRWRAERSELIYLRYLFSKPSRAEKVSRSEIAGWMCAHAPETVLAAAGRVFYRHMA